MEKATAPRSSHWLLSGTSEASCKKGVNATNTCFVHHILGNNCIVTPPSTPHQDPKCKPAGPPWGGRARASACVCTHTRDRRQGGWSSAVYTQFLKKRWFLSREWNSSPSASFVFPSYTKAAFSFFSISSTSAKRSSILSLLLSTGTWHSCVKEKT